MIKAVLFDFGGVLNSGGGVDSVPLIFGPNMTKELHEKLRVGLISDDEFFAELNKGQSPDDYLTKEQCLENARTHFQPIAEMYDFAAKLRAAGFKTGILSNVFAMSVPIFQERHMYDGFDPLVLSCEEKLAKPNPEFYEIAIRKLGVLPEEIVFIDDQERYLPPAALLGMHTILCKSPEQTIDDIRKILKAENNLEL